MSRLLISLVLTGVVLNMSTANAESVESSSLDFILGNWHSEGFGRGATELWTGDDSSLAGVFRGVLDDGRVITEFILIEINEDSATMRWNHFNEDFTRWETAPIEHVLVELKPDYANFEMPEAKKGLPRNLVYSREGDVLTVWVGDLNAKDQRGAFQVKYQLISP